MPISFQDSNIENIPVIWQDFIIEGPVNAEKIIDSIEFKLQVEAASSGNYYFDDLECDYGIDDIDITYVTRLDHTDVLPASIRHILMTGVNCHAVADLSNVVLTNLTDNDSLTWDSVSGKWVNEAVGGGAGGGMELVPGATEDNFASFDGAGQVKDSGVSSADFAPAMVDDQNYVSDDEKAALAGTDGTPSGLNKYVTDSDSRMDDARDPNAHNQAESTITTAITSGNLIKSDGGKLADSGFNISNFSLNKYDATTFPTVDNDETEGYGVGSMWIDVTNFIAYICLDPTEGAANWGQVVPPYIPIAPGE